MISTPAGFVVDGDVRFAVTFEHLTDAETISRGEKPPTVNMAVPVRSLLLRPLLWKTKSHVVRVTPLKAGS